MIKKYFNEVRKKNFEDEQEEIIENDLE